MSLKSEWKWLAAFALMSTLVIGLMTDFKFGDLEIQLYDTYYVFDAVRALLFLTIMFWTIKNLYMLVDLMTGRYVVMALIVSIVSPLIGLFMIILFYINFTEKIGPVSVFGLIITLLTVIEIRSLRKLKVLLSNSRHERKSNNA